jgi:hypothetical protein
MLKCISLPKQNTPEGKNINITASTQKRSINIRENLNINYRRKKHEKTCRSRIDQYS